VPAAQRTRSNSEVADDLRALVEGQAPGMVVRTTAPQGQFLLERVLGQQKGLQVGVRGYDIDTLGSLAQLAADVVRSVDGVTDVKLSQEAGVPQQEVRVDRARAADVGLSVRAVSDVLQAAFAGCKAGEFRAGGSSDRILMQLAGAEKRLLDEVLDPTLTNPRGERIALRNLVTTQASRGLLGVGRKNRQRLVTVQAGRHRARPRLGRARGAGQPGPAPAAGGQQHRRGWRSRRWHSASARAPTRRRRWRAPWWAGCQARR